MSNIDIGSKIKCKNDDKILQYYLYINYIIDNMSSALSVFEQKATIEALMLIKENPGCSKTMIMSLDPTRGSTLYKRIGELIKVGLVEYEKKDANWTQLRLYLTPAGQEIASLFAKMVPIMEELRPKTKE